METTTTNGIKISIEAFYQMGHSNPQKHQYIHAYRVTIENISDYTVKLLRRHWYIYDSNGIKREVEGKGVIGKQPVLSPGQQHQYMSWSPLSTDIGKMKGSFLMERQTDQQRFRVRIPECRLIAPFKLN